MPVPEQEFQNAMSEAGLVYSELPMADGQIHRFYVEGDRPGSRNGWYIFHGDGIPAGAFGSWKNGEWHKWCAKEHLSDAERREYRQRMKRIKAARAKEQAELHAKARAKAQFIWGKALPVNEHPYLAAKGVEAYGLRSHEGTLVVPLRDTDNEIHSLQFISVDDKKFLKEGATHGHYFMVITDAVRRDMGMAHLPPVTICEGYATGASIAKATDNLIIVAFDAGNLLPVAKVIRGKYPQADITIAADNDQWTDGNPGVTKATEAAEAINARIVIPTFTDERSQPTDFNDLHRLEGLDTVREQLGKAHSCETKPVDSSAAPSEAIAADGANPPDETADDFGTIPPGYTCNSDGVRKISSDPDKRNIQLTLKPVWVEALSRDGARENWGRLVVWKDHDGKQHERPIKAGRMHSRGNELAQELADAGLPIIPGKEVALLCYLAAFNPDTRLIAAVSTGWVDETFVLPGQVIGEVTGERIIFQPAVYHAAADAIYTRGSLAEWKNNIAKPAGDNELQRFLLSSAFVPPLRYHTTVEAGGVHSYGVTTSGKTTILQLAASVWGNAADPAQAGGDNVYIRRWNMTRHAMEGIAEAHNDLPLVIDEIGEGDGEEFGKLIYKVMSGTGRERADRTGGARKRRHWRAWVLSAGEVRVSTYIEEGGGKVRGGQLVRLIDIPADSIFPDAAAVDRIKDACANYFGTAGPAFVEAMINDGIDNVHDSLKALDAVADRIGDVQAKEEKRVRKRFALIAVAGEMAITMGILPWKQGTALSACQHVFKLWTGDSKLFSDAERGIANVRAFILKHGASRFEREDNDRLPVRDRAGWYRDGCYCFTKEAFAEACHGVLSDTVKKALSNDDLLHLNEPDRLVSKLRVDGGYTRVVSVKETILDEAVPNVPSPEEQMGTPKNTINKESVPAVPGVPTEKHQMQMKT